MGATAALWTMAAAAAASAASSTYQGNKQARAQESATRQAEQQAKANAEASAQAQRKQEMNQADVSGILQQNQNASMSGGSTLLTGAGGVSNLPLGGGGTLGA